MKERISLIQCPNCKRNQQTVTIARITKFEICMHCGRRFKITREVFIKNLMT